MEKYNLAMTILICRTLINSLYIRLIVENASYS